MAEVKKKKHKTLFLEAAIGIALLGGLILLSYSLIRPFLLLRTRPDAAGGLHLIAATARECINNDQDWAATVADPNNDSMECLRKGLPCDTTKIHPPYSNIDLKGVAGAHSECFRDYSTKPKLDGKDGFTKSGAACASFSAVGNPNCPYRFNVSWTASCPNGQGTCRNPVTRVSGDFVRGISDPAANADSQLELQKYALRLYRGRSDQTNYFVLAETRPSGKIAVEAPCNTRGTQRVFNSWFDPGGFIQQPVKPNGVFTLEAGTYACHVTVPGYRVGNFKALMMDVTQTPPHPLLMGTSEYSSSGDSHVQTRSEILGTLKLNRKSDLAVWQFCSGLSLNPAEQALSLGVPMGLGKEIPEVYSMVQCWVLSHVAK